LRGGLGRLALARRGAGNERRGRRIVLGRHGCQQHGGNIRAADLGPIGGSKLDPRALDRASCGGSRIFKVHKRAKSFSDQYARARARGFAKVAKNSPADHLITGLKQVRLEKQSKKSNRRQRRESDTPQCQNMKRGAWRCRLHGGLSSGSTSPEGKAPDLGCSSGALGGMAQGSGVNFGAVRAGNKILGNIQPAPIAAARNRITNPCARSTA
jgi:hypothetical protein